MDLHVVLGAGPAGRTLARTLVAQGRRVRTVSRSEAAPVAGAEHRAADLTDARGAREAIAGAAVVYHAANVPYEIGHAQFKSLARAQITGQTAGMLKILFHRETLQLLGIHCFGQNAAEIIHIGQAIMSQPGEANSLLYFINTTFNYPTMAEAYRVAALNGFNRLF